MTTTYQIIVDAYRQSNLIAIGVEPTLIQETEALRYLNRIVKSVFGNEVGEQLQGFPVGRKNIQRPSGYPPYGTTPSYDWFVPKNTRVNLNLEETGVNLYLHPAPDDGSRFAISDSSRNLSDFPVVVHGNGFFIEGAESLTLDTDGLEREWFFRADLAQWAKYSPLENFDTFPFPEEFDDYFILMLAFRLNPSYERVLDQQSSVILSRSKTQLSARYSQNIQSMSELGLTRLPRVSADRQRWDGTFGYYDSTSTFNKGFPW